MTSRRGCRRSPIRALRLCYQHSVLDCAFEKSDVYDTTVQMIKMYGINNGGQRSAWRLKGQFATVSESVLQSVWVWRTWQNTELVLDSFTEDLFFMDCQHNTDVTSCQLIYAVVSAWETRIKHTWTSSRWNMECTGWWYGRHFWPHEKCICVLKFFSTQFWF